MTASCGHSRDFDGASATYRRRLWIAIVVTLPTPLAGALALAVVLPCLVASLPMAAGAQIALSIPLTSGDAPEIVTARYACDGGAPFEVMYVNAGANRLAVLPVDGAERIFVNVVSASGTRYVSGTFEWWSKGDGAMLTDLTDRSGAQELRCGRRPALPVGARLSSAPRRTA